MSRRGWLGAGVLALVAGAVGADVAASGLLAHLDVPVLRAAVRSRTPGLTRAVTVVTDAGGWPVRVPLGLLAAGVLARRSHRWRPVVTTAAVLAAAPLASSVLKRLVGRARPPAALAVETPADPSFPSGHATATAALAVVLAALVLQSGVVRSRRVRLLGVAAAVACAASVGASRVYLGAHWLTDVLAGEALGAAVGLAVLQLLREPPGAPLRSGVKLS